MKDKIPIRIFPPGYLSKNTLYMQGFAKEIRRIQHIDWEFVFMLMRKVK